MHFMQIFGIIKNACRTSNIESQLILHKNPIVIYQNLRVRPFWVP
jgi:hypothetical protein